MTAPAACRIADLRREYGLRREDLASASGVSLKRIGELERGALDGAKALTLVRVAWALGLPVSEVWPALGAAPTRPGLIQRAAQARGIAHR